MKKSYSLSILFVLAILLIVLNGCSNKGAVKLTGEWISLDDFEYSVSIKEQDKSFLWADIDGKFPAAFKDGKLVVETGIGQIFAKYDDNTDSITAYSFGEEHHLVGKNNFFNKAKVFVNNFNMTVISEGWFWNIEKFEQYFTEDYYYANKTSRDNWIRDYGPHWKKRVGGKYNEFTVGEVIVDGKNYLKVITEGKFENTFHSLDKEKLLENGKLEVVYGGEEIVEFTLLYENNGWKISYIDVVVETWGYYDDNNNWVFIDEWRRDE